jgi:hypothetical protein
MSKRKDASVGWLLPIMALRIKSPYTVSNVVQRAPGMSVVANVHAVMFQSTVGSKGRQFFVIFAKLQEPITSRL